MSAKRFRKAVSPEKLDKVLDRLMYVEALSVDLIKGHKIVFFSDWHISDGSLADDFATNHIIANRLLDWYIEHEFTGFYVGDVLELWEAEWDKINCAQGNHAIFLKLRALIAGWDEQNKPELRGAWALGNHDKKTPKYAHDTFPFMRFVPALRLCNGKETVALVCHGHQADIWNKGGWRTEIANWVVKHVWTRLQCWFGADSEPPETSPAKDPEKGRNIAGAFAKWAKVRGLYAIIGHTHRPAIASHRRGIGYANIGSGVKDNAITCLELVNGELISVCWDSGGRHEMLSSTLIKYK